MTKIFSAFCLALLGISAYSQTFQISGKVVYNQEIAVDFADVLLAANDSVTQFTLTDEKGNFTLNAKRGNYVLLVKQLGDTLFSQTINVTQNIDLQTITVQKTKELQEVTIVAQKKLFERKADRMVFNAENMPSAEGGTVIDIMKLTPGLIVDNNSVSIVGKGLMAVMINDKIVQLSGDELMNYLKSVQANDVKSIEVITTPPAKYDAEGSGGLINIVLKKTPQNTWNGSVFGSYLQTKYGYGNLGGSFNYRKNKLSFYANLSGGIGNYSSDNERIIFYPTLRWEDKGENKTASRPVNARAGFDFEVTDNWTFGAQYAGVLSRPKPSIGHSTSNIFNIADNSDAGKIDTESNTQRKSNTHSANVHSIFTLDSLGRKINFDFDVLTYNADVNSTFSSITDGSQTAEIPNGFASQNNIQDRRITNYSTKIDVEHPIKTVNLNYGFKLSFSNTDNDIHAFDLSSGAAIENLNQSDNFLYKENTQAIYVSASTSFSDGKWQLQAGLRGENTQIEGKSVTMDSIFEKSYFELFPTAYLSYNMNEKNIFYAEYARRILRPSFWELNPFHSYSSPYYYSVGNPNLLPTITNHIVLGYVYNNIFHTIAYLGYAPNAAGGGIELFEEDGYTRYDTRMNYYDHYNAGVGLIYTFNKLSWWESQNAVQCDYLNAVSRVYPLTAKSMRGFGTNFQTYNIFYLNKSQTIQIGFDFQYMPPHVSEVTYSYTKETFGAFAKMLFLNKKLSVTLTGNNLFNGYGYDLKRESNGIEFYSKGNYEPRSVRLAVSYNFGSNKVYVRQREVSNQDEKGRIEGK